MEYRVVFALKLRVEFHGFDGLSIKFLVKPVGVENMGIEHLLPIEKKDISYEALHVWKWF